MCCVNKLFKCTFVCECRNVHHQIQEEMEKEQANLKSAQMETLEKLRQNLDRLFADEESRLRCVHCIFCIRAYTLQANVTL